MSRQLTSGVLGRKGLATPLLDLFPNSSSAYSLRLIRSNYIGNCLRVRRDSDDTELDIGFSKGIIDKTALLNFVGNGNGYVRTWYNQAETGGNATQTVLTDQPIIVENGVILDSIKCTDNETNQRFLNSTRPYTIDQPEISLFVKTKLIEQLDFRTYVVSNNSSAIRQIESYYFGLDYRTTAYRGTSTVLISVNAVPDLAVYGGSFNRDVQKASFNENEVTDIDIDVNLLGGGGHTIGRGGAATADKGSVGISEVVFWNIYQFDNHFEIQKNMNNWKL